MPILEPDRMLSGMTGFLSFWIGQVISLLGTSMSLFALTIWAYELTGSATALALVGFFFVTPLLVISPVAGALVDRSNRKFMMIISDLASGLATIVILLLYLSGKLDIWHLYVAGAFSGTFQAFQWPAFSAAITTMLPKEQYGRANGLMSLAETGSGIFAPLLAGALLGYIGLTGVLLIDIATFVFAITALLIVSVPQPKTTDIGKDASGSLWKESLFGFWYILRRPSLLGLQIVFMLGNFITGIPLSIIAPMILAHTNNNEITYGTVSSAGAAGGLIGGLAMSAWGGPTPKIHGVLGGWALASIFGSILMGFGQSLPVWTAASFIAGFIVPILNGSNQAIWQAKVAPDVQGRVFSIRRLIAWFVTPLAMLIAGPLADYVMEPTIQSGGSFAQAVFPLVGDSPGAGMSFLFILGGIGGLIIALWGYMTPAIRNIEVIMPDYEASVETNSESVTSSL
jgi:MFS family permease